MTELTISARQIARPARWLGPSYRHQSRLSGSHAPFQSPRGVVPSVNLVASPTQPRDLLVEACCMNAHVVFMSRVNALRAGAEAEHEGDVFCHAVSSLLPADLTSSVHPMGEA